MAVEKLPDTTAHPLSGEPASEKVDSGSEGPHEWSPAISEALKHPDRQGMWLAALGFHCQDPRMLREGAAAMLRASIPFDAIGGRDPRVLKACLFSYASQLYATSLDSKEIVIGGSAFPLICEGMTNFEIGLNWLYMSLRGISYAVKFSTNPTNLNRSVMSWGVSLLRKEVGKVHSGLVVEWATDELLEGLISIADDMDNGRDYRIDSFTEIFPQILGPWKVEFTNALTDAMGWSESLEAAKGTLPQSEEAGVARVTELERGANDLGGTSPGEDLSATVSPIDTDETTGKVDTGSQPVPLIEGSVQRADVKEHDKRRAAVENKPVAGVEISLGSAFDGVASRAEAVVAEVAAQLQEDLDHARRFVPQERADQDILMEKVVRAVKLGIGLQVDGQATTKLLLKHGKSLTWRVGSSGSRGFKKYPVDVSSRGLAPPEAPSL